MGSPVVVVGIGADGWSGLDEPRRAAIREAEVLVGGARHLALLPDDLAVPRVAWPRPLRPGLRALLEEYAGRRVVVVASGDPLVAGVGSTLVDLLGTSGVRVLPGTSSVSLARARLGWPAESVVVLRDHRELPRHLAGGRRVLVLSEDARTPATVARDLVGLGFGESRLTVLADLGGEESVLTGTAATWSSGDAPALHVLAVECAGGAGLGLVPGLPDDAYDHDGQLTRRDLRASALARLAPARGQLLWDVGAGAGSVGIEWMRAHPTCRTIAVEAHDARAKRIASNAARLGVPGLEVVTGRAPDALAELPPPDAVFVGGGGSRPGVLDACLGALRPGGRLVAHAVTLETESELVRRHASLGGELTRIAVETAAPVGGFTGWSPARAVTQWAWTG